MYWEAKDGTQYKYPGKLSYVAALNIAELANGQAGLNKSIDGGLGIGIRIDPNFHIVTLVEFVSTRQIRHYFKEKFENKPIETEGGTNLNALDENDNRFFYTKTLPGFSVRFIYVFGKGDANLDESKRIAK